jgi:capsular exopolysaccharide synthesis family protein
MDLRTYLAALRKSWILIALAAILGASAGALGYFLTPPTYASTIDFYVSTPNAEGNNPQSSGQFAESRVNSYVVLLSSEQLAKRVVDSTGVDLTPLKVSKQIAASAQLNTVIVTAIVTDGSPQRSLLIAQGVADNFPKLVDELDNQGRKAAIVSIHVVSGPNLQQSPISPDPKLYLGLGLATGLLLGLIIAVLREVLDNSVRTVESAQRLVGAPVIGTIVYDPDTRRSPLIVGDEATSLRSEAYRQLRTNLQFINAAKSANIIMVTSSIPLEGKSTTAVNLALTFVEFGERVLLIDADLRRPRLGEFLDVSGDVGLTNVLVGQVALDDVIQPWGNGGLYFLASGSTPPNPSELLGSARMGELIASVQGRYDKIVIDTPPVLPVTDAAVASTYAEAVVFVVRHGKTSRSQVANAAAALDNVDARIVGTVLNMKKTNRAERRRYGHHNYYGTTSSSESASRQPKAVETASIEPASTDAQLASKNGKPHRGGSPADQPAGVGPEHKD